jgi:hypothetical protein
VNEIDCIVIIISQVWIDYYLFPTYEPHAAMALSYLPGYSSMDNLTPNRKAWNEEELRR